MKASTKHLFCRLLSLAAALSLLFGQLPLPAARAAGDPLKPEDLSYENGKIVLHKQAERVGPEEWEVTVSANIHADEIHKRQIEMVILLDLSGSMTWCTDPAHGEGDHVHSDACMLNPDCGKESHTAACFIEKCTNTATYCNTWHKRTCITGPDGLRYIKKCSCSHTHTQSCCHHTEETDYGDRCYYYEGSTKVYREPRIDYAHEAIRNLTDGLPENTLITYAGFSQSLLRGEVKTPSAKDYDTFASWRPVCWTPLRTGTLAALEHFSDNEATQKFFVILVDGVSTEEYEPLYPTDDAQFKGFKEDGGTVFTIGFTHRSQELVEMAAPNGRFLFAEDELALESAIEDVKSNILAMIDDPMGDEVHYIENTLEYDNDRLSGDEFTTREGHIQWNPKEDPVIKGRYSYTYLVNLNDKADRGEGIHSGVPLNQPTHLNYSIETSEGIHSNEADFPIPEASYALSSVQVNWVSIPTGEDLKTPTDVEKIICDYEGPVKSTGGYYKPEFTKTDYTTITDTFPRQEDTPYYYQHTVITLDGTVVDAVDPTQPGEYVVTHYYDLVKPTPTPTPTPTPEPILRKLVIPGEVTEIGDQAFANDTGIEEVVIPDGLIRIGQEAFVGCTGLKKITIPASVESIGNSAIPQSAVVYCYQHSEADRWAGVNQNEVVYLGVTATPTPTPAPTPVPVTCSFSDGK